MIPGLKGSGSRTSGGIRVESDRAQTSAPPRKRRVGAVDLAGWTATMDMEARDDVIPAPIEEIQP